MGFNSGNLPRGQFRRAFVAFLVLIFSRLSPADTITLANGRVLQGEVVKDDGQFVTIRVLAGEIKLKSAEIAAIEKQTPLQYRLDLARQFTNGGRIERAVQLIEELYISDKNDQTRGALTGLYKQAALQFNKTGRFRDAREIAMRLQSLQPNGPDPETAQIRQTLHEQQDQLGAAISGARKLAIQERWAEAGAALQNILDLTPDARPDIAPDLARCLIMRAVELTREGESRQAAAVIERALAYEPKLADGVEKLYVSCALPDVLDKLRRNDFESGRRSLRRMQEFAPGNKDVLYVAGRTEEAAGNLAKAAGYYGLALRTRVANPTPEYVATLRKKLEGSLDRNTEIKLDAQLSNLTAFSAVSDRQQHRESEHFIVYHYNDDLASQVMETAEVQRDRIATELSTHGSFKGKIKIYIHRTQTEYTTKTLQPEWTGGASKYYIEGRQLVDPQIHTWQTSPRLLKSVLPHEITHLLVNCSLPEVGAFPKCLHEGFAVLMEPGFRHEYFMNFLRLRLKSQSFIPLSELLAAKDYPGDPEFLYAEGFAIVNYLKQTKGLPATLNLLRNIRNPGDAQAELLRISGARSIEELQDAWREWLLKTGNDMIQK